MTKIKKVRTSKLEITKKKIKELIIKDVYLEKIQAIFLTMINEKRSIIRTKVKKLVYQEFEAALKKELMKKGAK